MRPGSVPGAGRIHLVLVPGFGGFDVLGGLEYYAGTTQRFQRWLEGVGAVGPASSLHYFGNFPTAGVKTRAALLREFLAKRVARNQIEPRDSIVLVGHSTGGLDIRQLLCDLTGMGPLDARISTSVDGSRESALELASVRLRQMIRRVVFLSVPQRGTNIANWVRDHGGARRLITGLVRSVVDVADLPGIEGVDVGLAKWVTRPLLEQAERPCGLVAALSDVQLEMAERKSVDPLRAAKGRVAQGNVSLWLNHIAGDFLAIEDLAFGEDERGTPARFTSAQRAREQQAWLANERWGPIEVQSFATLGRCPFGGRWKERRGDAPRGLVDKALAAVKGSFEGALALLDAEEQQGKSDLAYRLAYQICAQGPFEVAPDTSVEELGSGRSVVLEPWENDGIVNTASMYWPLGKNYLVHADHGDIIGHFEFVKAGARDLGREYHTYDIFESSSARDGVEFGKAEFAAVWDRVFDFAALGR